MIQHVRHKDIDKQKWDIVVDASDYGLPYAYSWMLDIVSPGWEALIMDDYKAVMPLPVKQKFRIRYLIQPRWVQQLGIISPSSLSEYDINIFIKKIPYIFYDFNLNELNSYPNIKSSQVRYNMLLLLDNDIATIRSNYNNNTKRNIRKAKENNLAISKISANDFLTLWLTENNYEPEEKKELLKELVYKSENNSVIYGVYNNCNLVAALFAITTEQRIIYLAPVSSFRGKQTKAMCLLVDSLLEQFAETNKIFDFEGSMIEGVAQFYHGFGARRVEYYRIKHLRSDRLFRLIHSIKKLLK